MQKCHPPEPPRKSRRKRGRVARFFRNYFMCAGVVATLYLLFRLLIFVLVEATRLM